MKPDLDQADLDAIQAYSEERARIARVLQQPHNAYDEDTGAGTAVSKMLRGVIWCVRQILRLFVTAVFLVGVGAAALAFLQVPGR